MALNRFQSRLPQTGQRSCHDSDGLIIDCANSGQDAEYSVGIQWPDNRFRVCGELVEDRLTDLTWTRCANPAGFPLDWQEALDYVAEMNQQQALGFDDWRMPNRRELRSLISHQTLRPPLPLDHPFTDVFGNWYWTSTTAAVAPDHAWYISLDGGRMFFGGKDQSFMLWPVRGRANDRVLQTGQNVCHDALGRVRPCAGSGADAEYPSGASWPKPRFQTVSDGVQDLLSGLVWHSDADIGEGPVSWQQALRSIHELRTATGESAWRLPNINELESLVDCSRGQPALPDQHPFQAVRDVYWSATTSLYEPDWAWALYLDKGAVGVGMKRFARFHAWAVRVC
ncbi:MAG: DUF1566 domain-containing protein [Candidatus Thiodiazotropha sp.]